MEARAAQIAAGEAGEIVWLLEHPPLYTAGVSAKANDLLDPNRFPVFKTGRGGQFTYHGPGQRVAYVMLDLRERGRDVTRFVGDLERWMIGALDQFIECIDDACAAGKMKNARRVVPLDKDSALCG